MNKKPVTYIQFDKRWKNVPYRVKGESSTIGSSGCGPTSAAMILATMVDPKITPVETCAWSVEHGYKWLHQGTAGSYFKPQFAAYGINCVQVVKDHAQVKKDLANGYYYIALMGPGLWTSGGHYIALWGWDDKVRIADSASTKDARLNGNPELFKKQVRVYWRIDAREFNKGDDEMSYDQFKGYMNQYLKDMGSLPVPKWAEQSGEWAKAESLGIIADQSRPQGLATRAEVAAMVVRAKESIPVSTHADTTPDKLPEG